MSLLIASFQSDYAKREEETFLMLRVERSRALAASYALCTYMDRKFKSKMDQESFVALISTYTKVFSTKQVNDSDKEIWRQLFLLLDVDDDQGLSLSEFEHVFELAETMEAVKCSRKVEYY